MHSHEIVLGAKTVVDIAGHFDQLKKQARTLSVAEVATTRGHFTPTEDEEVKHLLVSYWQSRNALIELVRSHQKNLSTATENQHATFLVAYAGALVLIDAARFLRDEFHNNSLVRSKLNEPDPHFGIIPNTYERIQKSLTKPIHAWRLYHAAKYLNSNWNEINQLTNDTMAPVLVLVTKLQNRLNISVQRYSLARVRVRTRELDNKVGQGLFRQALYGLQKAVSSLMAEMFVRFDHTPTLRTDVAAELKNHLQPGDVLITRKEFAVTNYFLPGYWPHAALYLGSSDHLRALGIADHQNVRSRWQRILECDKSENLRVLEAMKDGVHIRSLQSSFGVDAITVLRPQIDQRSVAEALSRGLFHEGKPYDFDFDFNRSDRLVCTEVIYRSYEKVEGIEFELTKRAGRWTLAAEDLIRMALAGKHFEPYAVFSPAHHQHLAFGPEADRILRTTLQFDDIDKSP